jgi:hypothetical protein
MLRLTIAILLCLGMAGAPQAAQPQTDPLLTKLIGSWAGQGNAFSPKAQGQMTWAWVLEGRFAQIAYRFEWPAKDGAVRAFEGTGYYRPLGQGRYSGFWADNGGELHPIEAKAEGDSLIAIWGVAGAKRGKTQYRLGPDGVTEVVDWIEQPGGTWKEFNRALFKRSAAEQQ